MKKLGLLLITLFISIMSISAIDTSEKVYDFANVLTPQDKEELKELIDTYIETHNMDMAVVTVKYHDYSSTMEYADIFYDKNEFGIGPTEDGLVCVIDFSTGHDDFWISTKGNAIIMYDDERIEKILDAMDDIYYKNKTDYKNMFKAFVDKSSYYANLGIPKSNKHVKIDSNGKPYVEYPFPWKAITILSIIVSSIVVLVLIKRNKMVHKSTNADQYIDKNSISITNKSDQFLTTATSRIRIASSSSGGGRAGGSSFHSSGGGFHGGGGRSH